MRAYELMTIHRPDISEDDVRALVDGVEKHIAESGATVTGTDLWGKRRFAYAIGNLHEGYYSVISFQSEPDLLDDLDRMLTLSDEVVRHKVVRPGE